MNDFFKAVVAICGVLVALIGFLQFQQGQSQTTASGAPPRDKVAGTCIQGFVWREAYATDHVCVTPDEHQRVLADNAAANTRVDPSGPYGPDSCIDGHGWVWREANKTDHVCVSGEERDRVREDNIAAASRVAP